MIVPRNHCTAKSARLPLDEAGAYVGVLDYRWLAWDNVSVPLATAAAWGLGTGEDVMKFVTRCFPAAMFVIFAVSLPAPAETPTLDTDARPSGTTYLVYELHGGTWHDAEKDYADGGYEDGFMCWAAVTSNMLAWGGWNEGTDLADEHEVWEYFQTHWVSAGGHPWWGVLWWFYGIDDGYPARDVPGGGGFHPELNIGHYVSFPYVGTAGVLDRIRTNTIEGYVSGIRLRHPTVNFQHSVTCWGVNVDDETDEVIGIWITDSDDDPHGEPPRENYLRYFEVAMYGGRAHVQGYADRNGPVTYFITGVFGLAAHPARPEPAPADEIGPATDAPAPADETESPPATWSLPIWPAVWITLALLGVCIGLLTLRQRQSQG